MPYIKQDRRPMALFEPQSAGELNYALTMVVMGYLARQGKNYQTVNDILGALDGASKEFYRRIAVPYEDSKIESNGDVY